MVLNIFGCKPFYLGNDKVAKFALKCVLKASSMIHSKIVEKTSFHSNGIKTSK
jgi:hypothetical protein